MVENTILEEPATLTSDNPEITLMYKAGVHFGYSKTRRHPRMRPYIFGTKSNVEVFDLFKVFPKMQETLDAVRAMGMAGKILLFVGTKASAREAVELSAKELQMPYVTQRWLGGTLTNFKIITERVQYWQNLKRQKESGELKKYTKHEQTKLSQHITKLEYMFRGLEDMKRIPHALVMVDLKEEALAVREARRRDVDIIALSNTDTDPLLATHIVPGNDNAKASITYVLRKIVEAYKEGVSQKVAVAPEPTLETNTKTEEHT
ncbi:MAG: 30S ribosomal protein S2 [Candidatus Ryanbacteria bacterium RIFCSPLOWO2_02_FULL_45_11c]|uniref:Small ribosomal subunit protein uS2 n=1 Tax=Candidatus Ryanbacteria bacterium RIFCSPLOWO2_02_FULL_45_11c TaxID=1802128 RepID=A0A1G2GTJ6_9BACT|nr:MAG: 30S ribosomal protein S2 [Candidatus Ryanbacteria bacterium RIFCSPLOWO2_02_FULL_45_11c]